MTILTLIVSFLGGGLVSAIITLLYTNRAEKREQKIKFLDEQLRKLYGPLYRLTSQNQRIYDLCHRFITALYEKDTPPVKDTRKALVSITILKEYIEEVINNNTKIMQILNDNYSFVDPDDIDIFMKFYEEYIRPRKEIFAIDELLKNAVDVVQLRGITDQIRKYMSVTNSVLIERVKSKFYQKKEELEKLIR